MTSYMGRLLEIDLTNGVTNILPLTEQLQETFVGGKGLGAKLLYDRLPADTDPFSPLNPLMFMTGPLTGTLAPAMRACVVTKSPLTGTFLDSYFGGHFGQQIKYAGYDGLIIQGKASKPVYLLIEDDRVQLMDASSLWGLDTFQTYEQLKGIHGDDCKLACIGPAGEKQIRYALISCDYNRQAGRGGAGAVMGSKHLKAVVIKGSKAVKYHDSSSFMAGLNGALAALKESMDVRGMTAYGTAGLVQFSNDLGLLPTRNFSDGQFEGVGGIDGEAQAKQFWLRNAACAACPISCSKMGAFRRGKYKIVNDITEYESIGLLGSNLGLGDIQSVTYLSYLCDALGVDSISAGNVIGMVMEGVARGIFREGELQSITLSFGEEEGAITLLQRIVDREGELFHLLGEGVKRIVDVYPEAESFAVHVKGLELPAWGPRGASGMGLAYMTADRGGCHQRAFPITHEVNGVPWQGKTLSPTSVEDKGALVAYQQNLSAGLDCLVKCDFGTFGMNDTHYLNMLNPAIGSDYGPEDLLKWGERVWNLTRLFNLREGFNRSHDRLPRRLVEEPLQSGPQAGHRFSQQDMERMLDDYYLARGWDPEGRPTTEKLNQLGLT